MQLFSYGYNTENVALLVCLMSFKGLSVLSRVAIQNQLKQHIFNHVYAEVSPANRSYSQRSLGQKHKFLNQNTYIPLSCPSHCGEELSFGTEPLENIFSLCHELLNLMIVVGIFGQFRKYSSGFWVTLESKF